MSTRDLVREAEVIVCTGSGGVGKTTVAAVLAMEGALAGRPPSSPSTRPSGWPTPSGWRA
jgi:predicted ATPase